MSSRHLRAAVIGFMLSTAPLAAAPVWAATPATASSLQAVIANAAQTAASSPGFAGATPEAKLASIQSAVSSALATSGADPSVVADALIQAVESGVLSAGVAIGVASTVAPDFAAKVAAAPAVKKQLAATGQSATVTGATSAGGISVFVNLSGSPAAGGGSAAAYDPCAGVIATYCGS